MRIGKRMNKLIVFLCVVISFVGILFSNEDAIVICVSESANHAEYLINSVHAKIQDADVFEAVSIPQTFEAIRVSKYSSARTLHFSSIQAANSILALFVFFFLTSEILYLFLGNRIRRFQIITYIHNKDGAKS